MMPVISEKSTIAFTKQQDSGKLQDSLPSCSKTYQGTTDPSDDNLHEATIPITAIPIRVMNVQNPHIMRAYDIKGYYKKLDEINRKLVSFVKSDNFLKAKDDTQDPKIGDMVLVQSKNQKHMIDLPSFVCRGLITHIEEAVHNIFFVDYGKSLELERNQFCIVPRDFISDKHLTKVVGVYNVVPVHTKKNTSNDHKSTTLVAEEKWSDKAIQFAKDLLIATRTIYFDHLLTDEKNGREYGEFYLVIDDIVVPLTEALIITYHATYLERDLLQLAECSNYVQHKEGTKEEVTIRVKFSCDRINRYRTVLNKFDGHDQLKKFCLSEKILIHSTNNCGILNNVADLGFPSGVHKAWKECIKSSRPRKLQSYIWPAIKKGLNVIAIGSSQCGKTSACVMAVCGLVIMRQKELSRSATRPLALILCSSASEVINVHSLCTSLLGTSSNVKSVAAFNGNTDRSVASAIYNGCQILVTTPRYLTRFLNENFGLLSFDRLSYLVFDDADIILDKYYNSIKELFVRHNIIDREPQDDRPLLQIIMLATYWTPQIKKFARLVHNPYVCIASFIEAIVYKSVHPKIYILKSTSKNEKILEILGDDYMVWKTMVICTDAYEAEELNTSLLSMSKRTLLIHEGMKPTDMQQLQESWRACMYGSYPVLVCTDAVLSELNFTDIQWLIHHSVLLNLKNKFNYRFSVLLDDLVQDTTNCEVTIIIDENNNVQLQSILKIMARMRVMISPELQVDIERMAITLERSKKNYAICDNVKAFGSCQERDVCVFRHCVLPEVDKPAIADIQINDKVKLMVMYIHDASHFSARLIEHIPHSSASKKATFSSVEYMQITTKLQQHYQSVENRKMCSSTEVGDICVFEESLDIFKRVQIRHVQYVEVKFVDVRCIDSGVIYQHVDVRRLIHMPEELAKLPVHIVEVFLADIAPYDDECIWNYYSNEAVHKWFSENFNQRSYIIGKVRFHLGNTIWLDDLEIGTKLVGHGDLIGFSLKQHLTSKDYAVLNTDHMSRLFKH